MSRSLDELDPRHGTDGAYTYYKCRCEDCTEAHALTQRDQQAKRRRAGLPDGDERHGTPTGYKSWSCRCAPCTLAWRVQCREQTMARRERVAHNTRLLTEAL